MHYAGAGHPPLLIWGGSDGLGEFVENGLFFGRFSFATYSSVAATLTKRDRLLLYTDGIPETTNAQGVEFGESASKVFLEGDQNPVANQIADALIHELSHWLGQLGSRDATDDVT